MVFKEKMKGIGQEVKPMDNQIGFFDPVDFIAGWLRHNAEIIQNNPKLS